MCSTALKCIFCKMAVCFLLVAKCRRHSLKILAVLSFEYKPACWIPNPGQQQLHRLGMLDWENHLLYDIDLRLQNLILNQWFLTVGSVLLRERYCNSLTMTLIFLMFHLTTVRHKSNEKLIFFFD